MVALRVAGSIVLFLIAVALVPVVLELAIRAGIVPTGSVVWYKPADVKTKQAHRRRQWGVREHASILLQRPYQQPRASARRAQTHRRAGRLFHLGQRLAVRHGVAPTA